MGKPPIEVLSVDRGSIQLSSYYNGYRVEARCRFDDCNHLEFFDESGQRIYLHIDKLDDFISFLQDLSSMRKDPRENPGEDEFFYDD